ncbi:RHS repeat-associated core domain-containing protein [Pseudomonas entomophila]|uniref:RHS repeat-associated core domain-containing protein n=1 Tax=Pseudomonas entomophila TaxID=312306 RepID=UPI002406586A|nr:RHS repeat-associated core domain-containing protein [Pseudomonas entomophila]MDF9620145.1 RHS repeat-associated core domain-containing protein [Pseudomonas entomophila]
MQALAMALHEHTPTVTVFDNRSQTVREIAFHRHPATPAVTDTRITRHHYDPRGFLQRSQDPRLFAADLVNFTWLADLAGTAVRTQGVDPGISLDLNDIAGRPLLAVSQIAPGPAGDDHSQAVTRTWRHEPPASPGRLLAITEQASGEPVRQAERFAYAGADLTARQRNLAGRCSHHYDTAGLLRTDSLALTGPALASMRRLLKVADDVAVMSDWQGEDASVWETQLVPEGEGHLTVGTLDATGTRLTSTDAAGHGQRVAYDVAGQLRGSWLEVKGAAEQAIVVSLEYAAMGEKVREVHGNGVVTRYTREPRTQRLVGIRTEGPGAKVLQDLQYTYDPVGNVLGRVDEALAITYWRNQKIEPRNTYDYDSLYQLVSAKGREMAGGGKPGSARLPFQAFDYATYTNYTRLYTYDTAGNLTRIEHQADASGNSHTTDITVSDRSNRAVTSELASGAADVEELFTAGGQQKQLSPGQHLIWTPRAELLQVKPVSREGEPDDHEGYRYAGDSQRLLKVSAQKTSGGERTQRVVYLPGLELRHTATAGSVAEDLQVVCVGQAGRAQVRVLHWVTGKPPEIDNDQLRFSYDDLLGSGTLELDGQGEVISQEEYFPFGGTAVFSLRGEAEGSYKVLRYSGKERDATGLYYYGYRYYQPWVGRWLSVDPIGIGDGLNLFRMVANNPAVYRDIDGLGRACCSGESSYATVKNLQGKGPINLVSTSGVSINFSFSRVDSEQSFGPIPKSELNVSQISNVLKTSTGDQVTSFNGTVGYLGVGWDKAPLPEDVDVIWVTNGKQGAAGVNIELDDIEPGQQVVVTSGPLSGCIFIAGVRGSTFMAMHSGGEAMGGWDTSRDGVEKVVELYNRSVTSDSVYAPSVFENNSLVGLLDQFDNSSLAYTDKHKIETDGSAGDGRLFAYKAGWFATSSTLIEKNSEGRVSIETVLELGDVEQYKPVKTQAAPTKGGGVLMANKMKYKVLDGAVRKLA